MPSRPKRLCRVGGCIELTNDTYCAKHAADPKQTRSYDKFRGSSVERGYDGNWRRVRLQALRRDRYLCQRCLTQTQPRPTPATEVHHKIPIKVDPTKRLDLDNLQSVCHPCHMVLEDELRKNGIDV